MTDTAPQAPPAAPAAPAAAATVNSGASTPGSSVAPDQVIPGTAGYEGLRATDDVQTVPVRDKEFKLREEIPAAALLDLALTGDEKAPELERVRSIKTFLEVAIDPGDSWAFNDYLRSATPTIKMPELVEIIEDIIAKITGRPT